MKRRKKAKKFVISSLLIFLVLMIISPWISLFASLLLIGAASWGMSPTMELSKGYYAVRSKLYNAELEKVKKSSYEYRDLLIIIAIFLSVAFLSSLLLYLGWGGIISYLFT